MQEGEEKKRGGGVGGVFKMRSHFPQYYNLKQCGNIYRGYLQLKELSVLNKFVISHIIPLQQSLQ